MIQSLTELHDYTRRLGEREPHLHDSVLGSPGLTEQQCEQLRASLPGLPESYLACLRELDLQGRSLGFFLLWPANTHPAGMAASLIEANVSARNRFLPFVLENGMYLVAAHEAEPICVARSGPQHAGGEVFRISIVNPVLEPEFLADTFETFLLLVGNLDSLRDRYVDAGEGELAIQEFMALLPHFRVPERATVTWRSICEEALSD